MPCEFNDTIAAIAALLRRKGTHPRAGDHEYGSRKSVESLFRGSNTRTSALPTTKPVAIDENSAKNPLPGGRPASIRIPSTQIAAWLTPFTLTLPTTVAVSQRQIASATLFAVSSIVTRPFFH